MKKNYKFVQNYQKKWIRQLELQTIYKRGFKEDKFTEDLQKKIYRR